MALSGGALEGLAISAFVLSVLGILANVLLVASRASLEKRIRRTVDDLRAECLPGGGQPEGGEQGRVKALEERVQEMGTRLSGVSGADGGRAKEQGRVRELEERVKGMDAQLREALARLSSLQRDFDRGLLAASESREAEAMRPDTRKANGIGAPARTPPPPEQTPESQPAAETPKSASSGWLLALADSPGPRAKEHSAKASMNQFSVVADLGFEGSTTPVASSYPTQSEMLSVPLQKLTPAAQARVNTVTGKPTDLFGETTPSLLMPTTPLKDDTASSLDLILSGRTPLALRDSTPAARPSPSSIQLMVKEPPSPGGGGSARRSKPFQPYGPPLSARGIDPVRHPELHAKELAEMTRLLRAQCGDSAEVVSRTVVRCLWCHETRMCPAYRPQSFFFRDREGGGAHDGHYWTCDRNPNVALQSGKGMDLGEGKVLI